MNDEQRKQALDFGALGYSVEQIAAVWAVDPSTINISGGDLAVLYKQGAALSKYKIDMKLLEMAQSGDLKAIQKLEYQSRK